MSHHGSKDFENTDFSMNGLKKILGETGKFPDGKLNENDEGEIRLGMTVKDGVLIINFGKPIEWIGLEKKQVKEWIEYFQKYLKEM